MKKLLIMVFIGPFLQPQATFGADDEVRLKKQYQAPQELARLLDEAYEQDQDFKQCINGSDHSVCKCPSDFACYIKKNQVMRRLKGWEQAQHIAEDKNLNEIMLPQKYLWRNYLVAERLEPEISDNTLDGITKEQLSQLILFAKKGRFCDFEGERVFGTNNVFFTKDRPGKQFWDHKISSQNDNLNKIAFIDTKHFIREKTPGHLHNLWTLFSKSETDQCSLRNMQANYDVDWLARPNDFEWFWRKYKECFQKEE